MNDMNEMRKYIKILESVEDNGTVDLKQTIMDLKQKIYDAAGRAPTELIQSYIKKLISLLENLPDKSTIAKIEQYLNSYDKMLKTVSPDDIERISDVLSHANKENIERGLAKLQESK